MNNSYLRFFAMLGTSALVMYFLMFLNIFEVSHYFTSSTRIYMVLIMLSSMSLIMFFYMRHMYKDTIKNTSIIVGSVVLFFIATFGLRTQVGVGDIAWMKSMIPHHSTAILTSERADLNDPEVQELANQIIQTQREEIAQMKRMIERLESNN